MSQYFSDLFKMTRSLLIGLGITLKYLVQYKKHLCTVQYPRERDHIPPRHRGLHYLETEKCVMCWKCSEICPVDCIYIEGTRGSDGVLKGGYRGQKATLAKFTVDYTVCIFCGLCEEPCPPKCIWLGPGYDYTATDRTMMEKNLLTDEVYTEEDERFVQWARVENARLIEEKRRREEVEKAKAPPGEKAAATTLAAARGPGAEEAAAKGPGPAAEPGKKGAAGSKGTKKKQ
jgi:formate hydrogenlyase subunit 6/NADH:ubiquinone oxidoreductase subunit I